MVKPDSEEKPGERDELSIDQMDAASGGSVQIREVIIKAAVETVHTPTPTGPTPAAPKPIAIPYPNVG